MSITATIIGAIYVVATAYRWVWRQLSSRSSHSWQGNRATHLMELMVDLENRHARCGGASLFTSWPL